MAPGLGSRPGQNHDVSKASFITIHPVQAKKKKTETCLDMRQICITNHRSICKIHIHLLKEDPPGEASKKEVSDNSTFCLCYLESADFLGSFNNSSNYKDNN